MQLPKSGNQTSKDCRRDIWRHEDEIEHVGREELHGQSVRHNIFFHSVDSGGDVRRMRRPCRMQDRRKQLRSCQAVVDIQVSNKEDPLNARADGREMEDVMMLPGT